MSNIKAFLIVFLPVAAALIGAEFGGMYAFLIYIVSLYLVVIWCINEPYLAAYIFFPPLFMLAVSFVEFYISDFKNSEPLAYTYVIATMFVGIYFLLLTNKK